MRSPPAGEPTLGVADTIVKEVCIVGIAGDTSAYPIFFKSTVGSYIPAGNCTVPSALRGSEHVKL
jgi:hypothetical protein